ncbi:MAG: hypothetical protein ABH983_01650 [Candidatus Micrarchaeota archaeon]
MTFANTCTGEIQTILEEQIWIQTLVAVAFMLAVLLIALAYMFGVATQNTQLVFHAKNELAQLVISAVMIAVLLMTSVSICSIASGFTQDTPISYTESYLDNLVETGRSQVSLLIQKSLQNQISATQWRFEGTWGGIISLGGTGEAINARTKAISASQEMLIDLLLPMVASLKIQYIFIGLIDSLVFTFGIPFGLLFRILPGTRTAGDFILAACLGLYLVFPLTYVINATIYDTSVATDTDLDWNADAGNIDFRTIGQLIPQAIFLPNLAIVITTSFIMAFSKAMRAGFSAMEY